MISNIRLQNFRSYVDSSFEFEPGVNIIVGPNACGKTNLLEAISFITQGRSFRSRETDLIKHGAQWSRIDSYLSESPHTAKITKQNNQINKEFIIDSKRMKRLSRQYMEPVVVFEPNHLFLLHGSPDNRRIFFDNLTEHSFSSHAKTLRDYKKTLMQRNALLKSGRRDSEQMFVWNLRLSELGGKIVESRNKIIGQINGAITVIYSDIAGKDHEIKFTYRSNCNVETYSSSMLKKLEESEQTDYLRGFTATGPHRDDIDTTINGKSSAQAASRGETRTLLLALKIYELDDIEKAYDKQPILLLDDVFSELDGLRRKALTSYLNKLQCFITTTDADILSHSLVESTHSILIG